VPCGKETGMRVLVLVLLVAVLAAARASAHTPFEPLASSPDHVVTMIETDGPGKKKERVVTHHGEWTRVDAAWEGRSSSQYFKRGEAVTLTISHGKADEYSGVSVFLSPERSPHWDNAAIRTDERQTFLGETCTVWNVARSRISQNELTRTSCVTDDGIELWYRFATPTYVFTRAEATRVERRPVPPVETLPPRNALRLDQWFDNAAVPRKTPPDFEAVLERNGDGPRSTRTIRQRSGWTYAAVNEGTALRTLDISHAFGSFRFRYDAATPAKRAGLNVMTLRSPPISGPPLPSFVPQDMGKTEIVLGEQCRWYNLMPGVSDGYEAACRTGDGVTLKEEFSSWGSRTSFTAVRFARRPVAMDEIRPPPELLDRKRWSLPE
jgi:hypothetical protein